MKMAMSDKHRKLLITNRVDLVKDMQIDEELLSRLMGAGILTGDMKEQIEVGVMFLIFLCGIGRIFNIDHRLYIN